MSEPTRFFFDRGDGLILEHEDGCWVAYEDYARLNAEVERLRKTGAVMGQHLPDTDEANAAYAAFEKGGQS